MPETITLQDLHKELVDIKERMISKEEVTQMIEVLEILHNHETMQQIHASEADIVEGRTKIINGVKDLLEEMR